jgi:hypothetical protein
MRIKSNYVTVAQESDIYLFKMSAIDSTVCASGDVQTVEVGNFLVPVPSPKSSFRSCSRQFLSSSSYVRSPSCEQQEETGGR